MVIDLLGSSLEELRVSCGGKLSLKSVLAIGIQLLKRIESIHEEGIIHRDIKPDNFLIKPDTNMVYIIDFGLARRYITKKEQHITLTQGRKLTGTARYASVNVHLGLTPSRRDDLESIAYVMLYLLNGKLPWQAIKCSDKEKRYEKIGNEKLNSVPWTHFETSPGEFILFLKYCRGLDFDEDPDYNYLRNLLGNLYKHHGFPTDNLYEWS
jgi:serine/threonine protein kinase